MKKQEAYIKKLYTGRVRHKTDKNNGKNRLKKNKNRIKNMKTHKQLTHLIDLNGWGNYLHANVKHPFFCDKICSEEVSWKKLAEDIKKQIQFNEKEKTGNVKAEDILNAEMAEVYAAVMQGDYYHARYELMDVFAVLMRMDDMLRDMEGPSALPLLLEDDGIECRKEIAQEGDQVDMKKQLADFEQLVKEMRAMQKAYFRTREPQTLQACKCLESEVDRRLAAIEAQEDK
jgi:hypothetical protein